MLAGGIDTFKNTETMHTLIGKCNGASVAPHAVIFVFGMRNVLHKRSFIFESSFASVSIFYEHATTERKVEFDTLNVGHRWGVNGEAVLPNAKPGWGDAHPIKPNSYLFHVDTKKHFDGNLIV